jgi:hypothetical protein
MRNASCMNDFREVDHGFECLQAAYKDNQDKIRTILEGVFPGFCGKLEKLFNDWLPHFRTDTYIACISEHGDDSTGDEEDKIGRLSMWRAYGGVTGVAIVMKGAPFLRPSNALNAHTSPVAYLSVVSFGQEFCKVLEGFAANLELLRSLGEEAVLAHVFQAFRYATVCTKHPGFREEREWRVIYNPICAKSDRLIRDVHSVGGTPQPVIKIPLKNVPEEGLIGIEIPELFDRVIIGPTQYPTVIMEALVELLEKVGMTDAANRVIVSDIPLRRVV